MIKFNEEEVEELVKKCDKITDETFASEVNPKLDVLEWVMILIMSSTIVCIPLIPFYFLIHYKSIEYNRKWIQDNKDSHRKYLYEKNGLEYKPRKVK